MTINSLASAKRWRNLGTSLMLFFGLLVSAGMSAQTLPYNFDFTTSPFDNGWTQQSVSGPQVWAYNATFSNASMSAFSGGCQVNEDWLITPAFDLSSTTSELLSFDVQRGFAGDNGLEVLYSTNYSGTGDPNLATWTSIANVTSQYFTDNSIPNNTSETFGPFTELQAAGGTAVYVAFKFDYLSGECSTWRVAGFNLVSGADPAIITSTSSIGNLNYDEGEGPSEGQTFTVSGNSLTGSGNVTIAASAGFQVSLNNIFYSNSVNVAYGDGIITNQPRTLYVRLVAGLSVGDYSGNVSISGGGTSAELALSGAVSQAGVYLVDFEGTGETKSSYASGTVVLSGLEWNMTNTLIGTDASDFKNGARSARLRGYGDTEFSLLENLAGGIGSISFVYARYGSDTQIPYVVEYSTDNAVSWVQIGDEFTATESPLSFFAQVDVSQDVRVRFRTVAETGTSNRRMNIDDIQITEFGTSNAQIFATPASLAGLNYIIGQGPSAGASYTLSAVSLVPASGNISVSAPANFEISGDSLNWAASLNVAYSDGGSTIVNDKVYVRLAAGLEVGGYSGDLAHSAGSASATVAVAGEVIASSLPDLFDLSAGDYNLSAWSSEEAAGTYPANMRFQWSNDPSASNFNSNADGTGVYNCGYNLSSRPRVNGNGAQGFSFVSTGSPQYNDCTSGAADNDRFVGSAVVGLNTAGLGFARIEWLNRIITAGDRNFVVRLQYRIGGSGDFSDFGSNPEYSSLGQMAGDSATVNFVFPAEVLNQSEVYLRLSYFQVGSGSGTRPEMGIDDILITTSPLTTPLLSLSESSISGLYYNEGNGPSNAASYTLTGSNLSPAAGVVNVEAPANFELSLDGNSYSSSLALGYGSGSINEQIFVRLAAGLPVGLYSGGNISHAGGSASAVNVSLAGEVGYPVNLGVGDVSIIAFRSVANDGIAFANWTAIPAGTVILFSDNAFDGSQLLSNENLVVWQNTTGASIAAGTVVKIGGPEFGNGTGASLGELIAGSLDGLAQGGDNIFAFQGGTTQPSWVYGLVYLSDWLTEGAVSNSTSYLPAVLDVPFGNIAIVNGRNGQYNETREGEASFNAYKALVADTANWFIEEDGAIFGDFNTAPFVLGTVSCTASGGSLSAPANRSFCVGTGTPVGISVTATGASGTNQGWALVNSAGDIVGFRTTNSNFNLDIYPAGNYTIRYIRYENDVNLGGITNISQAGTLEGCFGLASNTITVFLRNEPTVGSLTALTPTTVCANAGPETGIEVALTGFDGENRRYAVVSQSLGNQVVLQGAGTATGATFNLNGLAPGTYRVFALAFQTGVNLNGVQFASDLAGCFDLSNPVLVNITDCAGATLASSPNPTEAQSFVTFSNPVQEYATLEVYDMSGRMVERLFNQVTNADQEYRLEFNGSSLPNGVYMYRLTTESQVIVEKFMIAR